MATNLLIVESPAKAKTIEKILGKEFQVKSCFGHIRDLEKAGMGIDLENDFTPRYKVAADKEKVVKDLTTLAKKSKEVWLATDEDREGEAISWHLCEVLGLDPKKAKRIVFHEITKPAIQAAVTKPRKVDMNLVMAQQARRILDRIVGFELSPVLWRKMSMRNNLSAGRVQSVAVRLIVEREREINAFLPLSHFKIEALFSAKDLDGKLVQFRAEGKKQNSVENANQFLQNCMGASYTVSSIQVKPGKRSPAPPFTTSTLQQEASRKLGYGVSRTMLIAQKLYENGYITYMRTDSVNLSDTALAAISETVRSQYGEQYHQFRKFKNKNESAQEAHEAIRPTYMNNATIKEAEWVKLYELIWKRTMASQMADAELEKTTAQISISGQTEELTASGEVLKFDGFLKVYMESTDEEDDTEINAEDSKKDAILPPLAKGQSLNLVELTATERYSRPPARYTEASLVKKLEELGIGRPSTYAPTISTVQNRGYVVKEDRDGRTRNYEVLTLKGGTISGETLTENTGAEKSKLFPTDIGAIVNDFLVEHFKGIVDFHFTAKVEKEFDDIAQGLTNWTAMLRNFYDPFHAEVQNTLDNAERANGGRELGIDPVSGKTISVRIGRFGPFVQIGDTEGEEKPRYASLRTGQMMESISLEDALELFKLPKTLGQFEDKDMVVAIGKFGPYVRHDGAFYSIPKEFDPHTIEEAKAIEIIQEKRQKDIDKLIKVFDENPDARIENGRWGPYIKFGKLNIKIPKDKTPESISYAEVLVLAEAAEKEPKKGGAKRFAKKK